MLVCVGEGEAVQDRGGKRPGRAGDRGVTNDHLCTCNAHIQGGTMRLIKRILTAILGWYVGEVE